MEQERFSLKDALFNAEKIAYLSGLFEGAQASFDGVGFQRDVMAEMPALELKARVSLIARVLAKYLPSDYPAALSVILRALPPELDPEKTDNDFGDFIFDPLGEFVATHGLDEAHLAVSLAAIKELTKRFSMEFALRPFLNSHKRPVMNELAIWAHDENYHVRRLVSEGTRPRLPWGKNIGLNIGDTVPFLDRLHADKTRYVTRSVANHLNDISKIDPGLVVDILARWRVERHQDEQELAWVTRHALRGLIKKGHAGALELLGFRPEPSVNFGALKVVENVISFGDELEMAIAIDAVEDADLLVDYVIEFVKADGTRKPKVFKWKVLAMRAGQQVVLTKKHRLKGNATTFRLYPGQHRVMVQVNGVLRSEILFDLVV